MYALQSPALTFASSSSSSSSSSSLPLNETPASQPPKPTRVQFADELEPSSIELNKPRHTKVKSWGGTFLKFRRQDDDSDENETDEIEFSDIDDIADLAILAPPESPPCYHEPTSFNYSSSYIDSSQLVGNPIVAPAAPGVAVTVNSIAEPVIDLDAALGPFRTPSFKNSPFEISHRRTESAPESVFSESKPFHSSKSFKRLAPIASDDEDVIIEEEEDIPMSPSLDCPTPPFMGKNRSRSFGQQHEAHNSSISLNSSSSSSGISSSNRDRDRARKARNYNSLSLTTTGSLLAMSLKNHSSSSLLSEVSANLHNSSNNTSYSNVNSVVAKDEVIPRTLPQDLTSKALHRLSAATNDTLTPSVSHHVYDYDENNEFPTSHPHNNNQDTLYDTNSSNIRSVSADESMTSRPFHLQNLRNVASFEEAQTPIMVAQAPPTPPTFSTLEKLNPSMLSLSTPVSLIIDTPEPAPAPFPAPPSFQKRGSISSASVKSRTPSSRLSISSISKSHSTYGLSFFTSAAIPFSSSHKNLAVPPTTSSASSYKKGHQKRGSKVWNWVRGRSQKME